MIKPPALPAIFEAITSTAAAMEKIIYEQSSWVAQIDIVGTLLYSFGAPQPRNRREVPESWRPRRDTVAEMGREIQ
jgi:hypothetical protein